MADEVFRSRSEERRVRTQRGEDPRLTMSPRGLDPLLPIALGMYAGEPCRVCGEGLRLEDIDKAVFAGYSRGNESRAAHGDCWSLGLPKSLWAFPDDEPT